MDSDEELSLFGSSSEEELLIDEDIATPVSYTFTPSTDTLPPDNEPMPSVSGLNLQYSVPETEDDDFRFSEKAYQLIDGGLSLADYEEMIQEKETPIAPTRYVTPAVQALIGQANMMFVKGDHEETLRLCKEAIRLAPRVAEPYRTLSELLEDRGDYTRALQLGILAQEMGPHDGEQWMALGDKALDLDMIKPAVYCFTKAVKDSPTLLHPHLMRIRLYEQLGERRNLITAYQKAVDCLPPEHGAVILEQAKAGAAYLHEEEDVQGALLLMETAFSKAKEFVQNDDINLIVELYLSLQRYEQCLEVISHHCNVDIAAEEQLVVEGDTDVVMPAAFKVVKVQINATLPPQLRAKLVTVLVCLHAYHLVDDILAPLLDEVEEYGDLVLDISEAFTAAGRHSEAVRLLKLLVASSNMSLPQVWLQYGEALKGAGKKEEAVEAFLEVMSRAPEWPEPRLMVSELLNELGRSDEAISALAQEPGSALDVGLLFERCLLLKDNPDKVLEFLVAGRLLLSRHCACIRSIKELTPLTKFSGCLRRQEALRRIQDSPEEETPVYLEGKGMPTAEEEWEIFRAVCDAALKTGHTALLQRLTFSALTSRVLCRTQQREKDLMVLAALSCYFNRDSRHAYNILRVMVMSGGSPRAWVLFSIAALAGEDARHQRFIIRLLSRRPSHPALPTLFANNCFMAGSYKQAVSEYLLQLKHEPSPLLALLVSVTFAQLASQKHATNVNALVAQAQAFMAQYRKLRGDSALQEVEYNLGRLHHHLNLLPTALYHYHQALETPALCPLLDLKREAAHNISLIYQASNSHDLARHYLQKYIVI